jgi:hypothetical protein
VEGRSRRIVVVGGRFCIAATAQPWFPLHDTIDTGFTKKKKNNNNNKEMGFFLIGLV